MILNWTKSLPSQSLHAKLGSESQDDAGLVEEYHMAFRKFSLEKITPELNLKE